MSRSKRPRQDTARVLALAIAFFGGLAALALANGVFHRLGDDLTLGLAAFAVGFGALTLALDADVRAFVKRLPGGRRRADREGYDPLATLW